MRFLLRFRKRVLRFFCLLIRRDNRKIVCELCGKRARKGARVLGTNGSSWRALTLVEGEMACHMTRLGLGGFDFCADCLERIERTDREHVMKAFRVLAALDEHREDGDAG